MEPQGQEEFSIQPLDWQIEVAALQLQGARNPGARRVAIEKLAALKARQREEEGACAPRGPA
jgi:hypothetical protein